MFKHIGDKVAAGERITGEEGLYLLTEANLLDLAPLAQTVRFRHNPDPVVTFVVDTNLNYTNVCDAYCTFCSFYRTEQDSDKYTYTVEEMMKQVGRAAEKGITTMLMQGGLNPACPWSITRSWCGRPGGFIPTSPPTTSRHRRSRRWYRYPRSPCRRCCSG